MKESDPILMVMPDIFLQCTNSGLQFVLKSIKVEEWQVTRSNMSPPTYRHTPIHTHSHTSSFSSQSHNERQNAAVSQHEAVMSKIVKSLCET